MTTELVLLGLRFVSGALLLAFLVVLFAVIWREYRKTASTIEAQRRSYGSLAVLREIDGRYMVTGEKYPLLPITTFGRLPTNTIPVDDNFASSEHAIVAVRDGQWWLEDRHSRNGTLLNDIPIRQPIIFTNGDIIGIGNIRFRLELED